MENFLAHVHSILVHFTIGLFITGFIVEVIGLAVNHERTKYAGAIMVIIGGVAGFLTMFTGEYAEENVEDVITVSETVLERHEEWGGWAGYFLLATALVRVSLFQFKQTLLRYGYLLLGGISLVVLLITGLYGGQVTHAGHPHEAVTGGQESAAVSTPPEEHENNNEDEEDD